MVFQIFAIENCKLCKKAQDVLSRLGVEMRVRYVEGPQATAENIADFAWYDWTDKMPLVVVTEHDRVLARWDGRHIEGRWMPEVKAWISQHAPAAGKQP